VLTCSLGDLDPGGSATVHITSPTPSSSCGTYANAATLSASNALDVHGSDTAVVVDCTSPQAISFPAPGLQLVAAHGRGPPFVASATSVRADGGAPTGLPVVFTASGPCRLTGNTSTATATVGLDGVSHTTVTPNGVGTC